MINQKIKLKIIKKSNNDTTYKIINNIIITNIDYMNKKINID